MGQLLLIGMEKLAMTYDLIVIMSLIGLAIFGCLTSIVIELISLNNARIESNKDLIAWQNRIKLNKQR